MSYVLKQLKDEKTVDLLWFVENGFHQMGEHRIKAKAELESRGIDTSKLKHNCMCNECKRKNNSKQ